MKIGDHSDTPLTTGQLAAMVGVSAKLIARYIDQGLMRGYYIPTPRKRGISGDRRVPVEEAARFFEQEGWDHASNALRAFLEGKRPIPLDGIPFTPRVVTPTKKALRLAVKEGYRAALTDDPTAGWVYFVKLGDATSVKIGFSFNPVRRFQHLQAGTPVPLVCMGVIFGGRREEARLHAKFKGERVSGEWFRASPALLEHIKIHAIPLESICEQYTPPALPGTSGERQEAAS
jgi:hypothetical protein